ncbi:hypothetical protein FSP39_018850 [Pinctada imbricata]|uniref:Uncharacterized protein n=1 Tax=Pinctada imbricata TaxID=66713 RepID=A0AA89C835_PINIB|nr:hypothetical protein FSP39_018850 [Pinctada imbricata]
MDLADDRRSTGVREEEVRSKVKAIHHIDVRKENIFLEPSCNPLLHDVITTCFCCESASQSIKNVANLLKSGGYLCMFGVLEQNSYRVRNFQFPSVNVKTEDIQSTITEIGFEILELKTLFNDEEFTSNTLTDSKNIYALFAKKL